MWDSTTSKACAAYKRIRDRVVDFNDLRVTMPREIVEFIGPRYPMAQTRAERLRAALRDTFQREHAVSLDRLFDLGKREIKKYLRSLDGVSPYVADRVTLLSFDCHCIPVDERLRRALAREGVCEESTAIPELASWLARQVKAGEAARTHMVLQQWADRVGGVRRSKAAASR
jgi:endonuclease III